MFDLVIIGGGINGCGIARDAAGRGLKVLLAEQGDIASATSSSSSKMVHGGLRYLEQYEFRLVRESLREREVMLRIAPHLVHPAEFIVPHDASMRPAWMVRAGLFLYDHIGGPISLPGSRTVRFPDARYSAGLKPMFRRGFFYSDTRVDDARLALANAVSASEKGADIRVRTRVTTGRRSGHAWHLTLRDERTGAESEVASRGVINAAGPWVKDVLDHALGIRIDAKVRMVKGSHIVVPRIHEFDHAYLLQNADGRVIFVIPYEDRFTLIGTTDVAIADHQEGRAISPAEVDYLITAVNRYLATPLSAADVAWSYAGVRPLYDDGSAEASKITRDYVLKTDAVGGEMPLLSIFGGKITTYRKLAEHVLENLAPFFPGLATPWTHLEALPGAAGGRLSNLWDEIKSAYSGLPEDYLAHLFRRHGGRTARVLDRAKTEADLGISFGSGATRLTEREIDYCLREEWATTAEDILWRRTKCGLHLTAEERERASAFMAQRSQSR